MPAINRLITNSDFWHCTNRLLSISQRHIRRIDQIRIDITDPDGMRFGLRGFVIKQPFLRCVLLPKPDDNAMHRSFAPRLTAPLEGAMSEMNLNPALK